jgi:MraZ protein
MKFFGIYKYKLDDKNRLSIPSSLLSAMGTKVYLSIGVDGNIELRTTSEFVEYVAKINKLSKDKKNIKNFKRIFFKNTQEINIDGSNRILISQYLREMANISKNVTILGNGNIIEL